MCIFIGSLVDSIRDADIKENVSHYKCDQIVYFY